MKVVSLFAGCGGLDLGFIKAGFEVVFANDFDKEAMDSYANNLGNHIKCQDIYTLKSSEVPDGDILIGGFPCLGFTVAKGKDRDLNSPYNHLFKEFARILKDKQPKYFLAENVTGIKSGGEFENFFNDEILKTFYDSGYHVKYAVLIASDYGVPQNRKRVLMIGKRFDLDKFPNYPTNIVSKHTTLRSAICDLPSQYDLSTPNHDGSHMRVKINGYVGNRALDWDKPSPTITGRGSRSGGAVIHPHPNLHRRLSARECARIQSFPDDFEFYGPKGAWFAQIGNAVPPLMAFCIANEFRVLFGKNKLEFDPKQWNLPYANNIKFDKIRHVKEHFYAQKLF